MVNTKLNVAVPGEVAGGGECNWERETSQGLMGSVSQVE